MNISSEKSEKIETFDNASIIKSTRLLISLAIATIIFNFLTGIASLYYGAIDKTIALTGFGIANILELIAGISIIHILRRIKQSSGVNARDNFENSALRFTGITYYILTGILVLLAGRIFYFGNHPKTAIGSIIIAGIYIAVMYSLYKVKLKIGNKHNSIPIIADAEHSKTNYYLAIVLLGASLAFELADVPYIDIVGGLGIAWFAYQEGKESFNKLRTNSFMEFVDETSESKN